MSNNEYYIIGVYDQSDDEWPYYFIEDGKYISAKGRIASEKNAKRFNTEKEAEIFVETWKNTKDYKFEFILISTGVEPKNPRFYENHPLTRIAQGDRRLFLTAYEWYHGKDPREFLAKSTFYRQRKILLEYGIDIADRPKVVYLKSQPAKSINGRLVSSWDDI